MQRSMTLQWSLMQSLRSVTSLLRGVETLTRLFRVMYAASMATEEGQSITFEVTWIDPKNPDPDPPERIVADRWNTVPFASAIPLSTRALVKAAKATDQRTSSFAVYTTDNGSLVMWGLVDQGNRAYDFKRFDSSEGPTEVGIFQSSATGLGHLTVSTGYEPIAELRIDSLSVGGLDPLSSGPISEALRLGYENYISTVKSKIELDIYEQRFHWDASLRSKWLATLARTLLRIRDMRHGGALLITPNTSMADLEIKYSIEYPRLRQALGTACCGSEAPPGGALALGRPGGRGHADRSLLPGYVGGCENGVWNIPSRGGVDADRRIEADVREEPVPGDLAVGDVKEAEDMTEHPLARGGNAENSVTGVPSHVHQAMTSSSLARIFLMMIMRSGKAARKPMK